MAKSKKDHQSPDHKVFTGPATSFPEDFYHDPYGLDRYVVQEKVLFSWKSPNKIDRQRTRSEMIQILLFFVLVGVVLLLLREVLLAGVAAAGAVLYLSLILTKPTFLDCHITTIGLKIDNRYYFWQQLTQFWFDTKHGSRVLYLRNIYPNVQHIKLLILPSDEESITKTLGKYLLYKKPQQTGAEKLIEQVMDQVLVHFDLL